jgi:hypothetical protein
MERLRETLKSLYDQQANSEEGATA